MRSERNEPVGLPGDANIVLIGMPGCGKTTVSRALAARTGRPAVETDDLVEARAGMPVAELIVSMGEEAFRTFETEVLRDVSRLRGAIISTGGGCVTVPGNYRLLHAAGRILWLQRDLALLPTDARPLSQSIGLEELFRRREPLYRAFADAAVDNNGTIRRTVRLVLEECGWEETRGV